MGHFSTEDSESLDSRDGVILHTEESAALSHVLKTAHNGPENGYRDYHLQLGRPVTLPTADRYREALSNCDSTTRDFLVAKGVFDVPDAALTNALVQLYFDHIDPHIPVIHKTNFLEKYRNGTAPPLLLNSVLFLGSHYADEQVISASRWPSGADMAQTFFDRARLIADFELEQDQITLIQSFVLLAQRWQNCTQERNPRYWMSRAINVGMAMGLFRR
ncbi:uncharacterized protein LTHEOB_9514 [Neofusicoccum parvum]|nr:uncharacterized protein LTHEOB_9514 [Neofusicoccum parvum]